MTYSPFNGLCPACVERQRATGKQPTRCSASVRLATTWLGLCPGHAERCRMTFEREGRPTVVVRSPAAAAAYDGARTRGIDHVDAAALAHNVDESIRATTVKHLIATGQLAAFAD